MSISSLDKLARTPSPVIRSGAGDISERELSRERYNLQTTPPMRVQPAHPKRQQQSAPGRAAAKFTARAGQGPGPQAARVRRCLAQYCSPPRPAAPAHVRPARPKPKAVSMEDLTPVKRARVERVGQWRPTETAPAPARAGGGGVQARAAARVATFMVVAAWRRRRHEVRCLRRTLECQVSCSERLRVQVYTLRALLDGDSGKLRLAMRELDRLRGRLADGDAERALLDKEKAALERDVAAAQDHASEMSIGWKSSRAEAAAARAAGERAEKARAAAAAARDAALRQRDGALREVSSMEDQLSQQSAVLAAARADVTALRRQLAALSDRLRREAAARAAGGAQAAAARAAADRAWAEAADLRKQLEEARAKLDWWPAPLLRLAGLARGLLRPLPAAALRSLLPATHRHYAAARAATTGAQ